MRRFLRPVCWVRTVAYSLRYWLQGGPLGVTIDGHSYGSPTYRNGLFEGMPVEWEDVTCEVCGSVDSAWRLRP